NDNRRPAPWLLSGALSGIIYFSQPLWLPSLLPIVLVFLVSSRRLSFCFSYVSGLLVVTAAILAIRTFWLAPAVEAWAGPPAGNPHLLASLPRLLDQIHVNFTGSYYFGSAVGTGPVTAAVAYGWLAMLALATLLQIYRLLARRYLLWSHLLWASVFSTLLANWILLDWRDARYVLAMNVPLVYLVGV